MKTMTKLGGVLAAMTITAAGTAFAGGPQWTYVDAGYARGDSFGNDGKNDLWNIGGSFGFMDMWHVQADYASASIDDGSNSSVDFGYDQWSITAGAHPHINDSTDLVFDLRYGSVSPDESAFSDSDLWSLAAGVDSMFTDKFELTAKVVWTNYNADDNSLVQGENVGGVLGGRYHWTENFSTAINYTIDDSDYVGADFRFAFAL